MFFHAEVEMPYMFPYDFNNNEYRPQVSPKNPKSWGQPQTKSRQFIMNQRLVNLRVAEREGFEPPVPLSTTVFKTVAIDHSAISP